MVLVSHAKRFIYTKTVRSGGTSVEIYFERYCVPVDEYEERHARPAAVTPLGIIGLRGKYSGETRWYNHMPAAEIRAALGRKLFAAYHKFCVVRNPFDKLVSWFFWRLTAEDRARSAAEPFEDVRDRFREFIRQPANLVSDRDKYILDGELCVDSVIRYETMMSDLERECATLDIPFEADRLGSYKSGARTRPEHFSKYYDDETVGIIESNYDFELRRFGYARPA